MLAALTKSLARSEPRRVSWTGAGPSPQRGGGIGTDPGAAVSEAGERSRVGGGTCGSGPAGAVSGPGERKGTRGTDPSGAVASVRSWSVTRGAIGTDPSGAVASREGINPGDELAGNDPSGSVDLSIKRQPNRFRIMLSAGWLPVAAVNSRSRPDAMLPEARPFSSRYF
jgi:hypothetical protein